MNHTKPRQRFLRTPRIHPLLLVALVSTSALLVAATFGSLRAQATAGERSGSTVNATDSGQTQPNIHDQINDALELRQSNLIDLEFDWQPGEAASIDVPIAGDLMRLDMMPYSVRAEGYRVLKQIEDGSMVEIDPGPVRTVRGIVDGVPGATVVGSIHESGHLHVHVIFPSGDQYSVQPVSDVIPGMPASSHVVYHVDDAECEGICGTEEIADHLIGQRGGSYQSLPATSGQGCVKVLLATDADFPFYQQFGSSVANVEARINWIINTLNQQYENEVGIIHELGEMIVRTSSSADPYSSNNAGVLLNQFANVWNSPPESSIDRDVAHLFTGRNLGSTLGIATVGTLCSTFNAYGLSTNLSNDSCASDLTAHELGHNWNALHCPCPNHTMNASITCSNQFNPTHTIPVITSFRDSVNCPVPCAPSNNTCDSLILVPEGDHWYENNGATTDGPPEPDDCTFFGDGDIQSDVWFGHIVQCTGELTISLCESSYNTKVAVYGQCPTESGTVLACDTSSCPDNSRSQVVMPVTQGQALRIRVGGHFGAQGEGILSISCEPDPDPIECPADLTGDGTVGVPDLLALINSWGACADPDDCPADLTGDGTVGVPDLLVMINSWGPCED